MDQMKVQLESKKDMDFVKAALVGAINGIVQERLKDASDNENLDQLQLNGMQVCCLEY